MSYFFNCRILFTLLQNLFFNPRKSAQMPQPRNVFLFQSRLNPRNVSISQLNPAKMFLLWLTFQFLRNSASENQGNKQDDTDIP